MERRNVTRELIVMSTAAYLERADKWCERLEKREMARGKPIAEARRAIARSIGAAPGTLFNLRNKRLKNVGAKIHDGLRQLLINELTLEIKRHEQEIQLLKELGGPAADLDLEEVEAQLAKIRAALKAA